MHVLNCDGYEIALLNNATCRWEIRRYSPQRWFPLPADAREFEFEGDRQIDCFNLDAIDTNFPVVTGELNGGRDFRNIKR